VLSPRSLPISKGGISRKKVDILNNRRGVDEERNPLSEMRILFENAVRRKIHREQLTMQPELQSC